MLLHGIELEEAVEVHKLYAGAAINLVLVHAVVEEVLHHAVGVRVAIGDGVAEQRAVVAEKREVAAPGVDADTLNVDATLCSELQSAYDFVVESVEIPIEMSAQSDERVVEARELLKVNAAFVECADDGASGGSSQING